MIAAGGVSQRSVANLIVASAEALGVDRELIPADAIRLRKADRIRELAQRFSGFVEESVSVCCSETDGRQSGSFSIW